MPLPNQTIQKFNDPALAEAIGEKLQAGGIDHEITNEAQLLDRTLIGDDLGSTFHLKIDPADFNRAHAILEAYYQSQLQNFDPDYYLLQFSDEELLEVLQKPDEWSYMDHALAKKLLAERGVTVTAAKMEALRQERIMELAKPERVAKYRIVRGYILAIFSILCGIIGAVNGLWVSFVTMILG